MASETRMEPKVELYTLEQLLSKGIPEVELDETCLRTLGRYSALAEKRQVYLLGYQAEQRDIITRVTEHAEPLEADESVMGVLTSDPLALLPDYTRKLPLARQLELYEDMREKPVEILENDEENGYLMLDEETALKGPLESLRKAKRIGSLFRLQYGYIGYLSDDNRFSLGIYAKSGFSGDERSSEKHPYSISLSSKGESLEEKAAHQGGRKEQRSTQGNGYVGRMESYRSSLNARELPYIMRGLLEEVIAVLTGKSKREGKRVWFWRDRIARLEEIITSAEFASCDNAAAESLEEVAAILKKHYYLRRKHPELWEKAKRLLRRQSQSGRGERC